MVVALCGSGQHGFELAYVVERSKRRAGSAGPSIRSGQLAARLSAYVCVVRLCPVIRSAWSLECINKPVSTQPPESTACHARRAGAQEKLALFLHYVVYALA
jgi:hypothetical protein